MPLWLSTAITIIFISFAIAFEVANHRKNNHQLLIISLSFIAFVAIVGLGCFAAATPHLSQTLGLTTKADVARLLEWISLCLGVLSIPIFVSTPSIEQNNNNKFIAVAILLGVGVIGELIVTLL